MATNTQPNRDTVYVDVDDEITSIIDKVRASEGRIIALVLPKRAAVLQSVVNMKLLKRSAEQAKKQLVLITTEAGLLPLAGSVGLHVAETLQSKPEIPKVPAAGSAGLPEEEALSLDDEPDEEFTADNAGDKPVGELANKAGTGLVITSGVETETPVAAGAAAPAATKAAAKPNKKFKVPNFGKFRTRMVLAVLGVLALIVFIYLAVVVLPKATIAIATNAEDVNSSIGLSLDTTASELDVAKANVPGSAVQQQKTYTQQVDATGKQNNGKAATGNITMTAGYCSANFPANVPTGTGVTANGKTYITQEVGNFVPVNDHGNCVWESNKVSIVAQNGGTDYNTSNATFSVNSRSDVQATGSASGGTDDITQVVSQADIDNAKKQIKTDDPAIKEALFQQLAQDGLFGIKATFQASDPTVSSSSQPGDKASTVTVTESVTYTMFGTKRDNLIALIKDDIGQQVDLSKQSILDDGLDKATFTVQDISDTVARLTLENTATVGPKIDKEAIAKQVGGMKSGAAKDLINQLPGVTDVNIKLSPFWVNSIPKSANKIDITVGKTAASN